MPAVTSSPSAPGHGPRLARDHRLVELGATGDDLAVGGHAGARPHEHDVADPQLADRDAVDGAIADALCLVRQQLGERADRAAGLAERLHLLPVPEQHDHDQRRQLPPELEIEQSERRGRARDERDGDRERDEQHHPRRPPADLRPRAREEDGSAVEVGDGAEDGCDPAVARKLGRRIAEPVLDHLAVDDDRDREDQRDPEATLVDVGVGRVVVFGRVTGVPVGGAMQLALASLDLRRVEGAVLRVVPVAVLHRASHVVTRRMP